MEDTINKFDFIHIDDWELLYLDGQLKEQGHKIRVQEILPWVNTFQPFNIRLYETTEYGFKWFQDNGMPIDFYDIPELAISEWEF